MSKNSQTYQLFFANNSSRKFSGAKIWDITNCQTIAVFIQKSEKSYPTGAEVFLPARQKYSRPRQIGLRKIFGITIGSLNIYSLFPRTGITKINISRVSHFYKYFDWETRTKFHFFIRALSRYNDGPYGLSCSPTQLCCVSKKIQISDEIPSFWTRSQNVQPKSAKKASNTMSTL